MAGRKATEDTKGSGGARKGAGRPKIDPEVKRKIILDELLIPAIYTALQADPGVWKDGYLKVELSKTQIKDAYGSEGLKEWMSYFTCVKIGGRNRNGEGYKTKWQFNINKYALFVRFVKDTGGSMKNLPKHNFPPDAMLKRLEAIELRRRARQLEKLAKSS